MNGRWCWWALGYWTAVCVGTKAYQTAKGREFSRALRAKAAEATPSAGEVKAHRLSKGSAIGRLAIPRLALSAIVVEGVGARDLELAAGHIPGTSMSRRQAALWVDCWTGASSPLL